LGRRDRNRYDGRTQFGGGLDFKRPGPYLLLAKALRGIKPLGAGEPKDARHLITD
jgi:hypothetical protein